MAAQYFEKKSQLGNNVKPSDVVSVGNVMEQKRSSSPVVPRSVAGLDLSNKKIIFKSDLEDLKVDHASKHAEILNRYAEISRNVDTLKNSFDSLQKQVEAINKVLDVSKLDVLKTNLNDAVSKMNDNLANVATQLVTHLDQINSLESRVSTIEGVFQP